MPRYQALKKIFINGKNFGHPAEKGLIIKPGEIIDFDPNLKEFYYKGNTARGDLSNLINRNFLTLISSSPIFETSNIGLIHASDIIFDPTGGIGSTNVQDAIVETYAESLQPQFIQEKLTITANGQAVFLLTQTPFSDQAVSLFVNSAVYINGLDFHVNTDVVTWLNRSFGLTTADEVVAAYFIDMG
jgi:hypothetical protein